MKGLKRCCRSQKYWAEHKIIERNGCSTVQTVTVSTFTVRATIRFAIAGFDGVA